MFEDSLLESTGRMKTKAGWTTMMSFGIQVAIIGILVLVPLIYTEALPKASLTTFLVAPPPPPPPPPPPAATQVVRKIQTDIIDGALRTPTKIPDKIVKIVEDEAPAPPTGVYGGVPGGVGSSSGGVLGGMLSAANSTPKVAVQKVRVSQGVLQGNAISQPKPIYPMIAKNARISGSVILAATISKSGTIENLRLVSGPPMLVNAAMDAVKQWRYKPYLLNGDPVEVETSITVNFTLGGG